MLQLTVKKYCYKKGESLAFLFCFKLNQSIEKKVGSKKISLKYFYTFIQIETLRKTFRLLNGFQKANVFLFTFFLILHSIFLSFNYFYSLFSLLLLHHLSSLPSLLSGHLIAIKQLHFYCFSKKLTKNRNPF